MKTIKQSIALAILMSYAPLCSPVLAADALLQGISAQAAGANKTEVRLQFNAPVTVPKSTVLENPPRLVFDFPTTSISSSTKQKIINLGKIQSVDAESSKDSTHIVIKMQELVNHSIEAQGNIIVVLFDNEAAKAPFSMSRSGKATTKPNEIADNVSAKPLLQNMNGKATTNPNEIAEPANLSQATSEKTVHTPPTTNHTKAPDTKLIPVKNLNGSKPLPEVPVPSNLNPDYAWYQPPSSTSPQNALPEPVPNVTSETVPPPKQKALSAIATGNHVLKGIDFRREPDGSGRVIITLPSADTKATEEKRGNTLTIALPEVDTNDSLPKRLDVMDFGTPVSQVDVSQRDLGTRIIVTAHEGFDYRVQHNGNEYTLYIDKLKTTAESKLAADLPQKKTFNGEKLSLNFQDIEVRAVLQLLADFTNKNIVVSDSVQGNITVRLKDVPWDQALDIVLESKNLAMRENGNVIWVAPAAELAAKEKQQLEAIKSKQELEPLITEYIPVNFAKAADLAGLIQKSQGEDKQSLLSNRGKISVDERTNTLLVQDTASQVKAIRDLVKALDVPVEQVLIESRIVIANDSFGKDLGARFGVTPKWINQDSIGMGTGHLGSGVDEYWSSATKALNDTTGNTEIKIPSLADRLSVNLPVTGAAGSFGFTILSKDFMVDLELSALQAESKGEIVSTPRVITSNQTKATIEQGVEIPYLQASSSGAANVAFKKAVLSLEVTPQITPDEHISMDLKVNQDTVGEIYSGVPSINTRQVQTKVLVENGQTVVLGGVHEQESIKGVTKVPMLGDLPMVGNLFRSTTANDKKRELLIFVTPKIVDAKL